MSPERSPSSQSRILSRPTFKKVQIVYYLSRNGQLEHPHYMEVTHLAHQHLRLKDAMDRLTVLRGKGMPSLYSWSCKRRYKNGFVWNDLSENDVIFPSEGAEYVLKGSELIEGCSEKLHQQLQVSNGQLQQESNFQPKRKNLASKRHAQPEEFANSFRYSDDHGEIAEQDEENEVEEYEEKAIYSRGVVVSTDKVVEELHRTGGEHKKDGPSELILHGGGNGNQFSPPPSTTSSTVSDKANTHNDGDPVETEPLLSRNSMLLSLIACGGSTSFRKAAPPAAPCTTSRKRVGNLQMGVVCREAAAKAEDDEMMMIGCMSENPRFGNLQAEEKEYFSGSIVETMANGRTEAEGAAGLKRSSSHNEERSAMTRMGDEDDEAKKEVKIEKGMRGKCIPRKKSSSSSSKQSNK